MRTNSRGARLAVVVVASAVVGVVVLVAYALGYVRHAAAMDEQIAEAVAEHQMPEGVEVWVSGRCAAVGVRGADNRVGVEPSGSLVRGAGLDASETEGWVSLSVETEDDGNRVVAGLPGVIDWESPAVAERVQAAMSLVAADASFRDPAVSDAIDGWVIVEPGDVDEPITVDLHRQATVRPGGDDLPVCDWASVGGRDVEAAPDVVLVRAEVRPREGMGEAVRLRAHRMTLLSDDGGSWASVAHSYPSTHLYAGPGLDIETEGGAA